MSADQHDDQTTGTIQKTVVSVADVLQALRPINGPNDENLVDQEMKFQVVKNH